MCTRARCFKKSLTNKRSGDVNCNQIIGIKMVSIKIYKLKHYEVFGKFSVPSSEFLHLFLKTSKFLNIYVIAI